MLCWLVEFAITATWFGKNSAFADVAIINRVEGRIRSFNVAAKARNRFLAERFCVLIAGPSDFVYDNLIKWYFFLPLLNTAIELSMNIDSVITSRGSSVF